MTQAVQSMTLSQSEKQLLLDKLVEDKWLDCEGGYYRLGVRHVPHGAQGP